jgi:hypothetical protein
MHPTLQQLVSELSGPLRGLTYAQILQTPREDAGRWNIHQIVEHLRLTYSSTAESMRIRLEKARPTRSRTTPSQLLARLVVLRFGLMPGRREAPPGVTPSGATPEPSLTGDHLIAMVSGSLNAMDTALLQAEALFGSAAPCDSHFALGPLSVSQWRRFHLVHGRHHIGQILAIRHSCRD